MIFLILTILVLINFVFIIMLNNLCKYNFRIIEKRLQDLEKNK